MKLSEIFQQAIDEKTPQIKGELTDWKGGYCAVGLIAKVRGIDMKAPIGIQAFCDRLGISMTDFTKIVHYNDEGMNWEEFRDYFRRANK